jgi:hypothetical protein
MKPCLKKKKNKTNNSKKVTWAEDVDQWTLGSIPTTTK